MIGKENYMEVVKSVGEVAKRMETLPENVKNMKNVMKGFKRVLSFYKKYKAGELDLKDPEINDTINQLEKMHKWSSRNYKKMFIQNFETGFITKDELDLFIELNRIGDKLWTIKFRKIRDAVQEVNA